MYATRHIDWLSFTIPKSMDFHNLFPLLEWRFVSSGMHGYRSRFHNPQTESFVLTDAPTEEMGHHFTFSGYSLAILRQYQGAEDTSLCNRLVQYQARSSRIDLTINIHQGNLTPRKIYDAYKAGKLTAKTKTSRYIEGINGDVQGDTLYLGSPKSDRQLRAYNKAAELGIVDGEAWLRLELELRRIRANNAFQSVASNGVMETVNGHMRDFAEWNDPEFQGAIEGPSVEPMDIPRRLSNRQRWLLGQVVKALASEIRDDIGFKNKFDLALSEELGPDYTT